MKMIDIVNDKFQIMIVYPTSNCIGHRDLKWYEWWIPRFIIYRIKRRLYSFPSCKKDHI